MSGKAQAGPTEDENLSIDRCIPEGPPQARNQIVNTMVLTVDLSTIRQIGRRSAMDLRRMAETGRVEAQVTPGE